MVSIFGFEEVKDGAGERCFNDAVGRHLPLQRILTEIILRTLLLSVALETTVITEARKRAEMSSGASVPTLKRQLGYSRELRQVCGHIACCL
jgi:hypothetical protein